MDVMDKKVATCLELRVYGYESHGKRNGGGMHKHEGVHEDKDYEIDVTSGRDW